MIWQFSGIENRQHSKVILERRKTKEVRTTESLANCLESVSRPSTGRGTQAEPRSLPEQRRQLKILEVEVARIYREEY